MAELVLNQGETWHQAIPGDLVVERNGGNVPLRDLEDIKQIPDFPTLVKSYVDLKSETGRLRNEIGKKLSLPGKDAKPEEVSAFKQKLYEAGLFQAPLAKAEEYKIEWPEGTPEALRSQELAGKLQQVLHKHGIPQAAVADLMSLNAEQFAQASGVLKIDREAAVKDITAQAATLGMSYQQVEEYGGRWLAKNIKEADLLAAEALGLADHPGLMWMIAKAGLESGEDISETGEGPVVEQGAEIKEAHAIMGDPKHPKHKSWLEGDPVVKQQIEDAFKKAYPGERTL